jgi:peptidoglycan/xylan/chitin deacetylase (PgdA/CDA1 family)
MAAPEHAALPARLVVLMYHGLHHVAGEPHFDPRYSVHPGEFERQMRLLAARRARCWLPGLPALPIAHDGVPEVMVSFDDGAASDAEVALPILAGLGLRAASFVTSGFVGKPGRVSAGQLRELAAVGMLIGAHGRSHRLLATLSAAELDEELRGSRAELEDLLGTPVTTLALPGGRGGAREHAAARAAGYTLVFGSQPGDNLAPAPPILQRVPVVRDTTLTMFDQLIDWRGPAARRLHWRHRLLQLPKRLFGDQRYDRWRASLVR